MSKKRVAEAQELAREMIKDNPKLMGNYNDKYPARLGITTWIGDK